MISVILASNAASRYDVVGVPLGLAIIALVSWALIEIRIAMAKAIAPKERPPINRNRRFPSRPNAADATQGMQGGSWMMAYGPWIPVMRRIMIWFIAITSIVALALFVIVWLI